MLNTLNIAIQGRLIELVDEANAVENAEHSLLNALKTFLSENMTPVSHTNLVNALFDGYNTQLVRNKQSDAEEVLTIILHAIKVDGMYDIFSPVEGRIDCGAPNPHIRPTCSFWVGLSLPASNMSSLSVQDLIM